MGYRTAVRITAALLGAIALVTACRDNPLEVQNKNAPDISSALGSPSNVETVLSKLFQQMYNGQFGSSDDLQTQTTVMSFESASQLANFGMGTRASIPRSPIDNTIGNSVAAGNFRDYDYLTRNAVLATTVIAAINKFSTPQAPFNGTAEARDRSFTYFTLGYALGYLSMMYDSAAVPTVGDTASVRPLRGSAAVNAAALAYLDSAIAEANLPSAAAGFPIPAAWMAQSASISQSRWKQILHSYKAKFMAGYPRTPAGRDALDWAAIVNEAKQGITGDLVLITDPTTAGWANSPQQQLAVSTGWSQMTPFILGMADTSGAYRTWLNASLNSRSPFLLLTPDKRFPQGATRAAQQAYNGSARGGTPCPTTESSCPIPAPATAPTSYEYFRMRPTGEDTPIQPWGTWYYDNWRFWGIRANGGVGPYALYPQAENDMLWAEGDIRLGNIPEAAKLIDRTRVGHGQLPALSGVITTTDQPVPGGTSCVPQVPQSSGGSSLTTACGNIFEAMKWEKRTETDLAGNSEWFIDSRGWGDLVQGTPLEWPVPYQDLYSRYGSGRAPYTTTTTAGPSTYGFEKTFGSL